MPGGERLRRRTLRADLARERVQPLHTVEVGCIAAGDPPRLYDLIAVRCAGCHLDERGDGEYTDLAHAVGVQDARDGVLDARYLAPGEQQRLPYFQTGIHQLFLRCSHKKSPLSPFYSKKAGSRRVGKPMRSSCLCCLLEERCDEIVEAVRRGGRAAGRGSVHADEADVALSKADDAVGEQHIIRADRRVALCCGVSRPSCRGIRRACRSDSPPEP